MKCNKHQQSKQGKNLFYRVEMSYPVGDWESVRSSPHAWGFSSLLPLDWCCSQTWHIIESSNLQGPPVWTTHDPPELWSHPAELPVDTTISVWKCWALKTGFKLNTWQARNKISSNFSVTTLKIYLVCVFILNHRFSNNIKILYQF